MLNFRNLFITFILCLVMSSIAYAQSMTISEIKSDEFPKIKCNVLVLDMYGKPYTGITKDDFDIIEAGKSMNSTVVVEPQGDVNSKLSIELVFSQCTAMGKPANSPIWNWLISATTKFLNNLTWADGSSIELITFNKNSYVKCPFTSKKNDILDSLKTVVPIGGTHFAPAFLDDVSGAIPRLKNNTSTDIRRVIIFVANNNPDIDESIPGTLIANEATAANVQVYPITLNMLMNTELAKIAKQTGGQAAAVYSQASLDSMFEFISNDIQNKQLYKVSWTAPYGCSENERYRDVSIRFKAASLIVKTAYTAPDNSVASVEYPNIVSFGNPGSNAYNDEDIDLTARGADWNIDNIAFQPNTFFSVINWDVNGSGTQPPFVIKKDQTRTIKVRFTQGAKREYRQATLICDALPCSPIITVFGGLSQVNILSPKEGEGYSFCDNMNINWAGVDKQTPISLYYNNGIDNNWNLIGHKLTGLTYNWKPPVVSNKYKLRAETDSVMQYIWSQKAGGTLNDFGNSLALSKDGMFLYACGAFAGTAKFDTLSLKAVRELDAFVAKFNRDGDIIWAASAGSEMPDSASGVCDDPDGNVYVVGTCYQDTQFGVTIPDIPVADKPYCFVAKYSKNGGTPVVNLDIGATLGYPGVSTWGRKIRFVDNQVWVQGNFSGKLLFNGFKLDDSKNPKTFTAIYDSDLTLLDVKQDNTDYPDYSTNVVYDTDNNKYEIGSFTDTKTFDQKLISAGLSDIYIYKYGCIPLSRDTTNPPFAVLIPQLSFQQNSFDLGDCTIGSTRDSVISGLLCNNSGLPVEITDAVLSGDSDFKLISDLKNQIVQPGKCIPIELTFTPSAVATRTAKIKISAKCSSDIEVAINANGVCSGWAIDTVNIGEYAVNKTTDSSVTCIFKNTNADPITVQPIIEGSADFTLDLTESVTLAPGECLNITIYFKPSALGDINAKINYHLDSACKQIYTVLHGVGVASALDVTDVDFGKKRIKSINKLNMKITNSSPSKAQITKIEFEDAAYANNAQLTIDNTVSLPLDLEVNASCDIPFVFQPQNENSYRANVLIYILGMVEPIKATISGEGILPKIELYWSCGKGVKVGESSTGTLSIKANNPDADLHIYSADFLLNTGEFSWQGANKPVNMTIPAGQTVNFPIVFSPAGVGIREDKIIVSSDAVPGPNENPEKIDTVDVQCEGIGSDFTSSIDYETILTCSELSLPLTITNTSATEKVILTSYYFDKLLADSNYFSFDKNFPMEINPSSSKVINITFKPDQVKDYSAKIYFVNSQNLELYCNLKGSAANIEYYTTKDDLQGYPGDTLLLPVYAKVPKLSSKLPSDYLLNFDLDIMFRYNMLRYIKNSFKSNTVNVEWNTPNAIKAGILTLTGSGQVTQPYDGKLFDVTFDTFLGDTSGTAIVFRPKFADCIFNEKTVAQYKTHGICFLSGRYVTVSNSNTYLKIPEPNPATDFVKLEFSAAFDSHAKLDIFDAFGKHISTLLDNNIKSGSYLINIDLNNFASGVYLVVYQCGAYKKTVEMSVTK